MLQEIKSALKVHFWLIICVIRLIKMSIILTILLKIKYFSFRFSFLRRCYHCNNFCLIATLGLQKSLQDNTKFPNTWKILLAFLAGISALITPKQENNPDPGEFSFLLLCVPIFLALTQSIRAGLQSSQCSCEMALAHSRRMVDMSKSKGMFLKCY